jgi:predicted dithiol-disulfide oxidoreductase (DUF899 family)
MTDTIPLPRIVSDAEWRAAHDSLMAKEKAATRARDALAAERRRQPMVEVGKRYVFDWIHPRRRECAAKAASCCT